MGFMQILEQSGVRKNRERVLIVCSTAYTWSDVGKRSTAP